VTGAAIDPGLEPPEAMVVEAPRPWLRRLSPTSRARLLTSLVPPFAVVLLGLIFSVSTSSFLTLDNLLTILNDAAVTGIIGIGMTFVLLVAGIDLSVGSVATLTTVVLSEVAVTRGAGLAAGMTVALLFGVLVGVGNGVMVVRGRVPPIIVTLGALFIVQGVAQKVSGGQAVSLVQFNNLVYMGTGYVGRVPFPGILLIGLTVVLHLVNTRTAFCRRLQAIGSNREAARLMGLKIDRYIVAVYAFSGFMAAVGGLVIAGQLESSSPNAGYQLELPVITAVVLGGTSLFGGFGSVAGTFFGAFLLAEIFNGLIQLGLSNAFYQQVFTGVILALAVALNEALRRRA
jgi:ribose/xylose/arabinose/galactoside ABC-type transport system permease subunit